MAATSLSEGVKTFINRFCPNPELLKAAFDRHPRRMKRLCDGEQLCRFGEAATSFWLVVDGAIRVERASFPLWRQPGEMVGEAAFYRRGNQVRGATLTALGDSAVFRIDHAFIDQLSEAERSLWHETMASVMASKLDEATDHRDQLRQDRLNYDGLVNRFVCADGREAALAVLGGGPEARIDAETCDALVWFSDLAGFSALAASLDQTKVATLVRDVMAIQERAIHAHGGQIDKFMGDGLMAFWRCPDAVEMAKASLQAVSAALQAADDVVDLFRRRALPCDIRIGLHVGRVVIGDFGGTHRIAFTLVGQAVNDASRYEQAVLCDSGKPFGRVRLSPVVFDNIQNGPLHATFDPTVRTFSDKHGRPYEVRSSTDRFKAKGGDGR